MKTSESQAAIAKALFEARREFPKIAKTKEGQAGNRRFKYAPMGDILDVIGPTLEKHQLLVTQPVDGHNVLTRVEHIVSGEWREASMPVNHEHANMQSYGIELTYRKRYAIQGVLGIITEEDTDGQGDKAKRNGVDHTRNGNGLSHVGASGRDVNRQAFEALQPEIQDQFRTAAQQADRLMPNVQASIDVMEMAMDNWPDEDRIEMKKGFWYLLDSATRTAISKEQKK